MTRGGSLCTQKRMTILINVGENAGCTVQQLSNSNGFQRDTNVADDENQPPQKSPRGVPRVRNVPIRLIKKGGQEDDPSPSPEPAFTEITFNRHANMCKTPGARKVACEEDADDKLTSRRVPIAVKHQVRMPRPFEREKDVFSWDYDFEKDLSPRSTDGEGMWGVGGKSITELLRNSYERPEERGRHRDVGVSGSTGNGSVIDSDIDDVGDEVFCWERERSDVSRLPNEEDRLSKKSKIASARNRKISSEAGTGVRASASLERAREKETGEERVDSFIEQNTERLSDSRLDAILSEVRLQDKSLAKAGARRCPIAGDGNCLYRAVAHAVYGNQGLHTDLRRRTVQYMRDHVDDFSPFLDCDPDSYFAKAGEDGEWAGYTEMVALMHLLNVDVRLTTGGTPGQPDVTSSVHRVREEGDAPCNKTVWLSWLSYGHYDAVEKISHRNI
ncbi:OTUD1 [Branchiostoma lanceolatum]|uniref:OTU domain-containing protein 1 n=2 Tax=Branchiostoma lanceolatum TaxID=7740 RepID=A0A8K0A7B0_BRALA|nr:OTUD1 [Branchiostoma lanceolatum]